MSTCSNLETNSDCCNGSLCITRRSSRLLLVVMYMQLTDELEAVKLYSAGREARRESLLPESPMTDWIETASTTLTPSHGQKLVCFDCC